MRRLSFPLTGGLLTTLLLTLSGCGNTSSSPFDGTWKVTTLPAGKEITMWLVRIDSKEDGLHASIVSAGMSPFAGATVEEVRADGDVLHLTFGVNERTYSFVVRRPDGEAAPKRLLGSTAIRGERDFARLERTELKTLAENEGLVVLDSEGQLKRAIQADPGNAREAALGKIIDQEAGRPAEYIARLYLVEALAARGLEDHTRDQAEKAIAFAGPYGPEMRRQALRVTASQVHASGKLPGLALDYARQAEREMDSSTSPDEQLVVLKGLADALHSAGKDDEFHVVQERMAAAEEELDRAFEKKSLPFEPTPFPGRRGTSRRAVLVELFTGANCPPCVGADLAFDALLRTCAPSEMVLVQYHLDVPSPDPLSNRDSERRARYYRVSGTPSLRINGREGPAAGGSRDMARETYTRLLGGLAEELETEAGATLEVTTARHGERIEITAEAGGVAQRGTPRLRLLLLEDMVRHLGSNGQRLHHHVVRAFPGGVDGIPVSQGKARQQVTIHLAELRKSLRTELADQGAFKEEAWPLALRHLKVVVLVQDDETKEVLQAAQADVSDASD
jgi:hypothetical protein